jgi:hypothetical protein
MAWQLFTDDYVGVMSVDDEAQPANTALSATICQFRILHLPDPLPSNRKARRDQWEMRERLALGVKSQIFGKPSQVKSVRARGRDPRGR